MSYTFIPLLNSILGRAGDYVSELRGRFHATAGHSHDGTAGEGPKIAVADLDTNPMCRAYHDAAQAIGTGSWTPVALNSERFDTDTIHDPSTNNSRLTCQTAGKYIIIGQVEFAGNATGNRHIRIFLNNATTLATEYEEAHSTSTVRLNISTIYNLAVNDYVELSVYQDSGGDLNVNAQNNHSPEFMMARLG